MKNFLATVAVAGLALSPLATRAGVVFSDDFESGNLNNWISNYSGVIVANPAGPGNVLTFNAAIGGGDLFSKTFSGGTTLSFDYYGDSAAPGGGFAGANFSGGGEFWLAGTVDYNGNLILADDNSWHHYTMAFPSGYDQVKFELWNGVTGNPGNGFFDNVVVTSAPDGGTTVSLLGVSLLGLVALRRKLA